MKIFKLFGCLAASSLLLTGCSGDEQPLPEADGNEISINAVHPNSVSRVNDTGFDKSDRIGVFVVDAGTELQPGGNVVNNGCYEYNGSAWSSARKYYWNNGTYNVYAYYPYSQIVDDTEQYLFELPLDQSGAEGFASADFLWAKAENQIASEQAVNLQFSHSMSNLVIEVKKADDYEGELPDDLQAYVIGTYTSAYIDLSNGGASVDSGSAFGTIKAKKSGASTFSAIVVPQRINSRRPLIEIVTGNVSYVMEGTMSFKPGYRHTITVSLSKSPEQVEIEIGGGIGPWN